jgi:hypothetical protein
MTAYADLEIGLHRLDTGSYAIELRYTQPESDADIRLVRDDPALVQLDIDRLRALALDTEEYGKLLALLGQHYPGARLGPRRVRRVGTGTAA